MAENRTPTAAEKKAEADRKAAAEQKAADDQKAVQQTRASIESAAGDAETRQTLVGAIAVTQGADEPSDVATEAAANLVQNAVRSEAGIPYEAPVDPAEQERREREAAHDSERRANKIEGDPLFALSRALADHQVGEPIYVDELNPPAPGQTERGWSPEVTARHPVVLAATMAELAGAGDAPKARGKRDEREHFIDPQDPEALATAQREIGFRQMRKTMLINEAIRVGSDRLAAAEEAASRGTIHAVTATREALDDIRKTARAAGHEID